jgi:hypothetical protein
MSGKTNTNRIETEMKKMKKMKKIFKKYSKNIQKKSKQCQPANKIEKRLSDYSW